ncbi:hypothetical protein C8Q74DRAFT_1374441 [Fomes fomentarius]|nr:hypothetical protein C8Q74DRAFT_1374441 [Fomes fomentarius]
MADNDFAAALVAAYPNVIVEQMCYGAMSALAIYEHLITFDREVRLVWRRKITGATVLFVLNKYLLLMRFIVVLTSYNISTTEVQAVYPVGRRLANDTPLAFAALRVYALTDHLWWLAGIIFLVSSVPVATNSYFYSITSIDSFIPPFNCVTSANLSKEAYLGFLISTRSSVILGDILVLIVTWYKTYSTWKTAASVAMKASFSSMILRDGTIYFLCFMTINVLHLAFSLTGLFTSTLVIFQDPLISILVSRFILDLRDLDRSGGSSITEPGRWTENMSLNFAAFENPPTSSPTAPSRIAEFIAPLGAPLGPSHDNDEYLGGPADERRRSSEVEVEQLQEPGKEEDSEGSSWSRISEEAVV